MSGTATHPWITPDWPAPANVRACCTTRAGGVSGSPYDTLNLGDHVGDNPEDVAANRQRVIDVLQLPNPPGWLEQVHGTDVQYIDRPLKSPPKADAGYTDQPGRVCVVMTADCLPLLICDKQGTAVAAAHAGWRGLLDGVIEQAIQKMNRPGDELMVWLGPAIGPDAFEVGDEVRDGFIARDPAAESAFTANRPGHWLADIYQLARLRLDSLGVSNIYGGDHCTYTEKETFYSYRREGVTGRMVSLIYINPE